SRSSSCGIGSGRGRRSGSTSGGAFAEIRRRRWCGAGRAPGAPGARLDAAARSGGASCDPPSPPEGVARGPATRGGLLAPPLRFARRYGAEQFRMLEPLFPGRIDLGVGRAPGSDQRTARGAAAGHCAVRGRGLPATARGPARVPARRAARRSSPARDPRDAGRAERPRAPAAGLERRERGCWPPTSAPRSRHRAALHRAARTVSVGGEALAYPYSTQELVIAQHASQSSVVGTPDQVKERLLALAAGYRADELVVVTITHDFKARLRSYEPLAEAF